MAVRRPTSLNLDPSVIDDLDYLVNRGFYESRSRAAEEILKAWGQEEMPRIRDAEKHVDVARKTLNVPRGLRSTPLE